MMTMIPIRPCMKDNKPPALDDWCTVGDQWTMLTYNIGAPSQASRNGSYEQPLRTLVLVSCIYLFISSVYVCQFVLYIFPYWEKEMLYTQA